jgi:hypothetical protein
LSEKELKEDCLTRQFFLIIYDTLFFLKNIISDRKIIKNSSQRQSLVESGSGKYNGRPGADPPENGRPNIGIRKT